jgi:Inner membrane component of T3SS, cytoplasmic domain
VRLDPLEIDPTAPHTLTATGDAGSGPKSVSATVMAAKLPPVLLSPTELPGLRPGDLIRVTVRSQPAADVVVDARVDGQLVTHLGNPPFEFALPVEGAMPGSHSLLISATGAGGTTERSFAFAVTSPAEGSPTAAYVLIGLAAAAGPATVGCAAWVSAKRLRVRSADTSGMPHGGQKKTPEEKPQPALAAPVAWGTFTVISGSQQGIRFALTGERELVGRGKSCSVRIRDRAMNEAHAVLDRSGTIQASSPSAIILVDGEAVRAASLRGGSEVTIGATVLRFNHANGSGQAAAPRP